VSPRDVQGLDFAPMPEGTQPAPGWQKRAPKGVVDLAHVITELMEMGRLPEREPEPEPRELQTVNILGATRTIPKPINPEKRAERLAHAEARRAALGAQRDADREAAEAI
jgi:hypothetical protein